MIGSLRGVVIDRAPARTGSGAEVVVDVGGVGYRVLVAAGTVGLLALDEPVLLWVHTHVREDALVLYGFPSRSERDCFEALIGAHGVGPQLALAVLTVHRPEALRRAVLLDDVAALCLVPGVGKKTAQKLLLDLKGRLDVPDLGDGGLVEAPAAVLGAGGPLEEVRLALAGLGYSGPEIASATAGLPSDAAVDDLLRMALKAAAR